jgi:glutathionylspermidine synthase
VKLPWSAGKPLSTKDWKKYRKRVLLDCRACGIEPRDYFNLARFPLLLSAEEWQRLATLAEKLTKEALAAEQELLLRTDLHEKLGLPQEIRRALQGYAQKHLPEDAPRVMRFDFHFTTEGWRITEVNADVMGGFIEGGSFTEWMAPYYPHCSAPPNPSAAFAEAILRAAGKDALIVIVRNKLLARYRGLKSIAREVRRRGMRTAMRLPGQILWRSKTAEIAGARGAAKPDLLIRFYNADWLPRLHRRSQWVPWFSGGDTPVSNPARCMVIQSKRWPLAWDELHAPMTTWRRLLPETRCPSELVPESLSKWVIKPVWGRAGAAVGIAGVTDEKACKRILKHARRDPTGWVAQRRFESLAVPTVAGPQHVCLGIFTIDGRAAGAYGRMAAKPLVDGYAEEIGILIQGRSKQKQVQAARNAE